MPRQTEDKLRILPPDNQRELILWVVDELTFLGEIFAEELTEARLKLYAQDLCDLPRPQLEQAFKRSRRELKFFPRIAELRELAGASARDGLQVEAQRGWQFVMDFLSRWGGDCLPLFLGGNWIDPPEIPSRVRYALKSVGGLKAVNQTKLESMPFVRKDFLAAYLQAPLTESLAPRLDAVFGEKALQGKVRQLAADKQMETVPARGVPVKRTPAELTDEQRRDQRRTIKRIGKRLMLGKKRDRKRKESWPAVDPEL